MALALYCYLESVLPQAPLNWGGALCNRLCCFSSRRKGSETFEDDCHFPVSGPTMQQPNFEEDALWALLRKIPGVVLWGCVIATATLSSTWPLAMGWILFMATVQTMITLSFSMLYTYRGFKKIEEAMMNPVTIPPLVETRAESPSGGGTSGGEGGASSSSSSTSTSSSGSGAQQGAPSDAVATQVDDVIQPAQVLHIVAICRCTEPVEVLEETIDNLATHSNRACYIILLCLEAKDKHAAAVGESLVRKYAGVFFRVMYAIHPGGIEWEVPGKSANVNWGARAAYASLEADMGARALDRMVVTVADCDAKVSEHYFNELSVRFAAAARDKREVFWAPPMLFDEEAADLAAEMNALGMGGGGGGEGEGMMMAGEEGQGMPVAATNVSSSLLKTDPVEMLLGKSGKAIIRSVLGGAIPGPVKIADQLWSMFVLQNLASANWVRLPCSTYSVGIKLIASVGFWDAGVESVPEDYHTALKVYWGTSGRARCEPIFHPVLYQHIDGGSWMSTVYQRYQQGVRHMWGATDVAYILWLSMRIPTVPWAARMRLILTVLDVHVSTSLCSFFATFAVGFLTLFRPGWLISPEGLPFLHWHENMVLIMFAISMGTGCVYEWYASEMVAACKRAPLGAGAGPGQQASPLATAAFASPVGPLGMQGMGGKPSTTGGQGQDGPSASSTSTSASGAASSSMMSRSPSTPTGSPSPVNVPGMGMGGMEQGMGMGMGEGMGSFSGSGAPVNLTSALDQAAAAAGGAHNGLSLVVPQPVGGGGGGGQGYVSVEAGGAGASGASSPYHGSPGRLSSAPRERSLSVSLGRGRLAWRDRSFLSALATCTATSVWEYALKLLPWAWSPVCCVLYLSFTAATANTKLLYTNRMRPHVSPKSVPTPSATPRQGNGVHGGTPGSSTPTLPRMQSLAGGDSGVWESGRSTPTTGQGAGGSGQVGQMGVGAGGRSIRLQLPNAAFGGTRNPSSGQFQSLVAAAALSGTPNVTPRYGGTAEHRGDVSPGRHGNTAWA